MRKEYGKALHTEFARQLKAKAPEFRSVSLKSIYVFPGNKLFRWVPSPGNHCFIILVPHYKSGNDFVVELGWSRMGRFPELNMRPSTEVPTWDDEFLLPEYVCRIGMLYGNRDKWWRVGRSLSLDPADPLKSLMEIRRPISVEEAQMAVNGAVTDAISRVLTHGIPYLRKWANMVAKVPLSPESPSPAHSPR